MTYTAGYLRSGSSSYPGGRYTSSGRSCGSPSGLPRSNSLLMTCSSMRPARSADQGSTAPPQAGRRAQTPFSCRTGRGATLSALRVGLASSGPSIEAASRTSDVEEDGLAVTLQADVEPELPVRLGRRDERGPPRVGANGAQHRVGGVGGLLVGEVHPGHHAVEQAAREYRHVQVRRLDAAFGGGQRTGLERDNAVRAVRRGRAPAEAAEALVSARRGAARVVGVREPPVGPGLPGLDQPVRDDVPGAVVEPPDDRDRPGGALGHHERAVIPGQSHAEVRAYRL